MKALSNSNLIFCAGDQPAMMDALPRDIGLSHAAFSMQSKQITSNPHAKMAHMTTRRDVSSSLHPGFDRDLTPSQRISTGAKLDELFLQWLSFQDTQDFIRDLLRIENDRHFEDPTSNPANGAIATPSSTREEIPEFGSSDIDDGPSEEERIFGLLSHQNRDYLLPEDFFPLMHRKDLDTVEHLRLYNSNCATSCVPAILTRPFAFRDIEVSWISPFLVTDGYLQESCRRIPG